ncbi:PREDICTED: uncharacterized protein LOC108776632 [Cyphomyrmex costatus]|uniref:uncharacterized protein LOC108776632 n=1 Tax=Cyphomyrmex costatus TaxID=456900 RepID=UPI0008522CE4|nr:PREDICTED: uncharacterized protein LOC108776632 [Cyphomyrmex costatus]
MVKAERQRKIVSRYYARFLPHENVLRTKFDIETRISPSDIVVMCSGCYYSPSTSNASKMIRHARKGSSVCTIAIKCGFHSHIRDLMDLRLKRFKQKLTPMEQLMVGVVAVALRFRSECDNVTGPELAVWVNTI